MIFIQRLTEALTNIYLTVDLKIHPKVNSSFIEEYQSSNQNLFKDQLKILQKKNIFNSIRRLNERLFEVYSNLSV